MSHGRISRGLSTDCPSGEDGHGDRVKEVASPVCRIEVEVNDFEDDPTTLARDTSALIQEASQPNVLDDAFVRRPPDLGNGNPHSRLLEESLEPPRERAPILRSAMKGGRRKFLADADERARQIAADQLQEQGKQRDPKSRELAKARKQIFGQVHGGKEALKQAALPADRRQFNRVAFASNERAMDFDFTDAPSEISAQKESDKGVWQTLRGGAVGSNELFENQTPIKTEEQQQDVARKNNFRSQERSKATLSRNTKKLMGSLQQLHAESPEEATGSAYFRDNNMTNVFKHNVGAAQRDGMRISEMFGRRLKPATRAELMEQANILGASDTNNTDATVHAQAQGQARSYSKNERADVARFANNRGSGFSRFFGGIGDFFSKVLPGAQRLFGTSRDNRFEAAPGQREARDLLRQEQDTFRRDARSGKLGFMRMLFGRSAGSGRTRLPIGPRQEERPPTSEEYASEQRALAAKSDSAPREVIQPPAVKQQEDFPAVEEKSNDSLDVANAGSLDGEEIKQAPEMPAEDVDDQMLELSSMDGVLGNEDE